MSKINPCYLDALYNLSQLYEDMEKYSMALDVYWSICSLRKVSLHLLDKIQSLFSLTEKKDQKRLMNKLKASAGKKPRGNENLKKVYQHLLKKNSRKK